MAMALGVMFATLNYENGIKPEEITTFAKEVVARALEQGVTVTREGETAPLEGDRKLKMGDIVTTDANQTATVVFDEYGEIRMDKNSVLVFSGEFEEGYVFNLTKGNAWINNLYTSSYLNVQSGGALLMPGRAVFDLSYDGVTTRVRDFKNHINVGLVQPDYNPERTLHYKNAGLINSFLMAEGSQSSIFLSKIQNSSDVLGKLLYSKLIKEFQYGLMDTIKLRSEGWVALNMEFDADVLAKVENDKRVIVESRGLKFSSLESIGYKIDGFLNEAADVMTFSQKKRNDRLINSIFDHLMDAEYLLAYGRNTEAMERLNLFKANLTDEMALGDDYFKGAALNKLRYHYANLNYVMPTDNLFPAKEELSNLLVANLDTGEAQLAERLELVRDYMNYTYALADKDIARAKIALEQYSNKISDYIKNYGVRLGDLKYMISEDNQIMDNLFRRYPGFYQDSFFEVKYYLETEWLKMLPEGVEKLEEQQTIISTKIDFLKQLQINFLAQKVNLNDAKRIALRLINEIQDLQPNVTVGVNDLFALRLKDYGNFLLFLNSTDVASLRGSSPQQQYDNFLAAQREQISVAQAISQFFGEGVPAEQETQRTDLILQQVINDFDVVGLKEAKLGPLESTGQKYIEVYSAKYGDVQFSARYDWDNKQISQIKVGTTVVSQNPIRLSNIALLLAPKEEEPEVPVEPEEPEVVQPQQPEVSRADRVAKILLIQKLRANDISVLEENITIADSANQMYVVNGATLVSKPSIQVAFVFNNREDVASSLTVRAPSGDYKLTGSVALAEISTEAQSTYDSVAVTGTGE